MGWATLPLLVGIAAVVAAPGIQEHDRSGVLGFGIVMVAVGLAFITFIVGMRIEVDDESLSKVYFFGLFRKSIPLGQLTASSHVEDSKAWSYTRVDFENADGEGEQDFSVYPFWVWRSADVDELREIAADRDEWRAAHPGWKARPARPTVAGFAMDVFRWSWLWVWGAIVPVLVLELNWSGQAALVGIVVIELAVIVLVAIRMWAGSRRPRINTFASTVLVLVAGAGILMLVPEIIVLSRWGAATALAVCGGVEALVLVVALVAAWNTEPSRQ